MNLPPEIQFHEDLRLFVWRPRGVLAEAAIDKVLASLEELEAKSQEPFNRFADTTAADEVELNFEHIIQFSLHRRLSYAGRPPVKSAILATEAFAAAADPKRFPEQLAFVKPWQATRLVWNTSPFFFTNRNLPFDPTGLTVLEAGG